MKEKPFARWMKQPGIGDIGGVVTADGSARVDVVITRKEVLQELAGRERAIGKGDAQRDTATQLAVTVPPGTVPRVAAEKIRKRPEDLTADEVRGALDAAGGNKTRAAEALGIAVNTLKKRMREHGLS